jgi:hypothetical protein
MPGISGSRTQAGVAYNGSPNRPRIHQLLGTDGDAINSYEDSKYYYAEFVKLQNGTGPMKSTSQSDIPTTNAERKALANVLAEAIGDFSGFEERSQSSQVNRVMALEPFELKLIAWRLLVRS